MQFVLTSERVESILHAIYGNEDSPSTSAGTMRRSDMRAAAFLSILAIAIAASATARERAFHPTGPTPMASAGESTLCAFSAPQLSGYRTKAGERKICYYDCGGLPTAIVIRSDALCSGEQTVFVWDSDSTLISLERRPRGNGKTVGITPAPLPE